LCGECIAFNAVRHTICCYFIDMKSKPIKQKQADRTTGEWNNNEDKKMETKVLETMKDVGKPVRPGEITKLLNVDSKEVSKAIKSLKNKGEIISPKRCFYSLP